MAARTTSRTDSRRTRTKERKTEVRVSAAKKSTARSADTVTLKLFKDLMRWHAGKLLLADAESVAD